MIRISIKLLKIENVDDENSLHRFSVEVTQKTYNPFQEFVVLSKFKLSCDKQLILISRSPLDDDKTFTRVPDQYEANVKGVIDAYLRGYFKQDGYAWIDEIE